MKEVRYPLTVIPDSVRGNYNWAIRTPPPSSRTSSGPCDHCTMEPIVVKDERPKKKKTQTTNTNTQQANPLKTLKDIVN